MQLILTLTSIITNVSEIKSSFFEQQSFLRQVIRDLNNERNGMYSMTVDTISENVRTWLCYKGFPNREAIIQLQQLGGGFLAQAIHMLYVSIPRAGYTKGKGCATPRPEPKYSYQQSDLEAIRALCSIKHREHEENLIMESADGSSTFAQENMEDRDADKRA